MSTYRNGLIHGGGIGDDILKKFTWEKYDGERHFPYYNYLGPHSRLEIRTDENYKPRPNEEPINQLDSIALKHDIAYDKIKKEYSKDRNKQKALTKVHNADEQFIREAKNSNVQPLGTISAGIIKAKEIAEKVGVLDSKTFSGMGNNKISFTTKSGKVVTFNKKKPDPTARLKALAGISAPKKEKSKKMTGGFAFLPLLAPILASATGALVTKLFDVVKNKIEGNGYKIDPEIYKEDQHKRAFLKRVLY